MNGYGAISDEVGPGVSPGMNCRRKQESITGMGSAVRRFAGFAYSYIGLNDDAAEQ